LGVVNRIEVTLAGPRFDRASLLAREAIAAVVHGGATGWEAALEPTLTEMANDRAVGALTSLLLMAVAANAVLAARSAEMELGGEPEPSASHLADRALELVDELLCDISSAASVFMAGERRG
jgi:hypothetical protein